MLTSDIDRRQIISEQYHLVISCFSFFRVIFFFFGHTVQHVSSLSGMESVPPTVEAWSLNHWTAREVDMLFFKKAEGILMYT